MSKIRVRFRITLTQSTVNIIYSLGGDRLGLAKRSGAAMKVLAADRYILCSGLLRTLLQLYNDVRVTSALPPIADIRHMSWHLRFVP